MISAQLHDLGLSRLWLLPLYLAELGLDRITAYKVWLFFGICRAAERAKFMKRSVRQARMHACGQPGQVGQGDLGTQPVVVALGQLISETVAVEKGKRPRV